jgi:hypothetical protein
LMGGLSGYRKFNDGEDYYNETYGGNRLWNGKIKLKCVNI